MSANALDVPVLIAAEQIRRREFVTIRRGYDPDQVRDYLEQLADQVELMATMIRDAQMETDAAHRSNAEPKVDPYEQLAGRVATLLREADDAAERFRIEGRRDAERILGEARSDAERIRSEAQTRAEEARTQAERALHDAREQADRTIAGLSTRREALVEQLAQMQSRLLAVANDLEAAIEVPTDPPAPPVAEAGEGRTADERPVDASSAARVIDIRSGEVAPVATIDAAAGRDEDLFAALDDPSYEALWEGTEAIELSMPDIPPLDLSWDDDDGGERTHR